MLNIYDVRVYKSVAGCDLMAPTDVYGVKALSAKEAEFIAQRIQARKTSTGLGDWMAFAGAGVPVLTLGDR